MPVTGYVAMVLGIVFSVILGAGLMARMLAATASTNRHRSHRSDPLVDHIKSSLEGSQMRAAGVKMARL